MNNFILALILLVSILLLTLINSFYICSVCDDILALLDSGRAEEAASLWNEKKRYISIFVRDAEMDIADAEAEGMEALIPFEDGEAESGILKFRDAINEIKQSEKLSFESIFYIDTESKKVYYLR